MKRLALPATLLAVGLGVAGIVATSRERAPPPVASPPTAAELAARTEAAQRARPHTMLRIDDLRGEASRDGAVLVLSGVLTNAANFDIENPHIRCLLTGPSHTQVGQVAQTLEAVIPARASRPFSKFNVGAMGPGTVTGFNCSVAAAAPPIS